MTTSQFNEELSYKSLSRAALGEAYVNHDWGRQILHVTFVPVLTHIEFKPRLLENLDANSTLHVQLLETCFAKHLAKLSEG